MRFSNERGFIQAFVLLILLAGLGAGGYLVQQKTNFLPKAYELKGSLSGVITPHPTTSVSGPIVSTSKYYFELSPLPSVFMTSGADGYSVMATLRDAQWKVVTNQKDVSYQWSVDTFGGTPIVRVTPFSDCTNGIIAPCPNDHATIGATTIGPTTATNVRVKAIKTATNTTLAEGEFNVSLVQPDDFVTFRKVHPYGGENLRVGQQVPVRWEMDGKAVDYYNVYYQYYLGGKSKGGYIGEVKYPATSLNWTIPQELQGRQAVIVVDPRRNGVQVGQGRSDNYFNIK